MTHFPIAEYEQLTEPKTRAVYDAILAELYQFPKVVLQLVGVCVVS